MERAFTKQGARRAALHVRATWPYHIGAHRPRNCGAREHARVVPSIWTSYKWGSCETYPDLATVVLHVYKVCSSSDGKETLFFTITLQSTPCLGWFYCVKFLRRGNSYHPLSIFPITPSRCYIFLNPLTEDHHCESVETPHRIQYKTRRCIPVEDHPRV